MKNEKRFLDALGDLFTGAAVEGDSGFINLMRMKQKHFEGARGALMAEIDAIASEPGSSFREELFDKLHTFFSCYFCDSGSVYFRRLPAWRRTYERVFANGADVALTWKTRDLYYVKSDYLVKSMPVVLDGHHFYFDAANVENRKNNERKSFVYSFDKLDTVKKKTADGETREIQRARLRVSFSANGSKTKTEDVLKALKKARFWGAEEARLNRAFALFARQTQADFFINKNAGGFLREQFHLWMVEYALGEDSDFGEKRMLQLRGLRKIAHCIINFIAQFEDELARVWNKPKFARAVHYVVTLNKLKAATLKNLTADKKGIAAQTKEWRELALVGDGFSAEDLLHNGSLKIKGANGKYKFLPLDTRHFGDSLTDEVLADLGDLDSALDGELIKSENYQALNTLAAKYRGRVKCIYIDPPFNLDSSDQFDYRTNYKDASWATLLENRLTLARDFLSDDGGIFVRCDYHGDYIVRCLLDGIFGGDNLKNPIVVKRGKQTLGQRNMYASATDMLYFYCKNKNSFVFNPFKRPRYSWEATGSNLMMTGEGNPQQRAYKFTLPSGEKATLVPPPDRRWKFNHKVLDEMQEKGIIYFAKSRNGLDSGVRKIVDGEEIPVDIVPSFKFDEDKTVDSNWTDIQGYSADWEFNTENSEQLLHRSIGSVGDGIVLDFFAGSGTTQAVAQKLGRKWLGVEMGEHFDAVVLPRLKKVLAGYKSGISNGNGGADYKGGGAFKYYALEQYEETLKNMRYKDGELVIYDKNKTPFEQYVFLNDDKFAHAVQTKGRRDKKIALNLSSLYKDIDIAETLANAVGSPLRKKTADAATFVNGETIKINPEKMSEKEKMELISRLKSYIWWGE